MAYDTIDASLAGMLDGLGANIEGGWACKPSAGIEFGYPVFGYIGLPKSLYGFKKDTAKLVFDADFVSLNSIIITVNGVATDPIVFATDHDTTAALVVAAVSGLTGVECVLDTTDTNSRTFYIQVKGETAVVSEAITLGASQATGTVTYTTSQVFVGIAVKTQNSAGIYEQYDAVNVLTSGRVFGVAGSAADANEKSYVSDAGLFANAGVEIGCRFRGTVASSGNVLVQMEGQKELGVASLFSA